MKRYSFGLWIVMVGCTNQLSVDSKGPAETAGAGQMGYAGQGAAGRGAAGVSAGGGGGAAPGSLGQPCVVGTLSIELQGTPVEATVRTLDHCDDGLTCRDGQCVPVPDCPSPADAVCAIYRPSSGSGDGGIGPIATPGGSTYSDVTDMVSLDGKLYWSDYGTRDELGVHRHDGAVLGYDPSTQSVTTLISGLAGPIGIGITSGHAYVTIDGAPELGSIFTHPQILRAPFGGTATLVQDQDAVGSWGQTFSNRFVAAGDQAFWEGAAGLYSMSGEASAVPVAIISSEYAQYPLNSDATNLYYSEGTGLFSMPLAGGSGIRIFDQIYGAALKNGLFYGTTVSYANDTASMALLSGSPSDGTWRTVRELGIGKTSGVQGVGTFARGDYFFVTVYWNDSSFDLTGVTRVSLGADPPIRLLAPSDHHRIWAATADALYWSYGREIHVRSLSGI